MLKNGNKLVLDQDSSGKDMTCIQNKRSSEKIWLRQENGVYVLDLMEAPPYIDNGRSTHLREAHVEVDQNIQDDNQGRE